MPDAKRTIVLIHGLWLTPGSWEPFRNYYSEQGYEVLAPPWPRLRGAVEDIRRDPSLLNGLGIAEIVEHYEEFVRGLDEPPILIGHGFGGLCVQLLLDRGLGDAGVAIDAAAPRTAVKMPPSQARALWPVLKSPANRSRTVALRFEQFRYAFANNMSHAAARAAYELDAIPGPGRPVFQASLSGLTRRAATKVNYHNRDRAPLLLIAGAEDHIAPASVTLASFHRYRDCDAITAIKEFPGRSHLIIAQSGWEDVAEHALRWALGRIERGPSSPTAACAEGARSVCGPSAARRSRDGY